MTTIVKVIIGVVVFVLIGTSGTAAFFAHKASMNKQPSNNVNIRLDHIKKGANVVIDGNSLAQFLNQRYRADSSTISLNIDSLKIE